MVDSMILILFFYFFEIFLIYFGSSWWLDFLVGIGARMCVDIFEVITTSIPAQAPWILDFFFPEPLLSSVVDQFHRIRGEVLVFFRYFGQRLIMNLRSSG